MITLKSQALGKGEDVAIFVSKNNIKREDILNVVTLSDGAGGGHYTIFYYGDSDSKEIIPGFFGW